jgi:hypothetical protein
MESASERRGRMWRSRWAAIGAAVAVTVGAGGVVRLVGAASSDPSSFVAITPVRVLDTRDPNNVGLAGPFVSAVSQDLIITGTINTTIGDLTVVPVGATAVSMNVTVVSPSADGFLSVRPADAPGAPTTSSLNFTAGDIVPNAVDVQLPVAGADAGRIEITYDAFGSAGPVTDVLIDVVGYFVAGAAGAGPPGPPGPAGWDVIPSGVTVTGFEVWDTAGTGTAQDYWYSVDFPALAPIPPVEANFATDANAATIDDDALCTGTAVAPTAPAGRVCVYLSSNFNATGLNAQVTGVAPRRGFLVNWGSSTASDMGVWIAWAYMAP